jgi:uncharacterized protein YdhG (YjbR/CyaY superfamily)
MEDDLPETTRNYLAPLPEVQHAALLQLRRWIIAAVPQATELLNYGVPAFKLAGGPLVSLGAAKKHCAFYVQSPAVSQAFVSRLTDLDTSPGTIRFTPDKPLDRQLVEDLITARIAEREARANRT